jgi:hypothetical protein
LFQNFEFDIEFPNDADPAGEKKKAREHFYCIVATKQRPLDIK